LRKQSLIKFNYHPYGIVIIDDKKRFLDYSKAIEICDSETDDEDNDIYEIVVTMS
jgi:hypothetical protein